MAFSSRHLAWIDYAAERVKSLCLPDMPQQAIFQQKFPWNRNQVGPNIQAGIFVSPLQPRRSATSLGGLTATNLWKIAGYPAQITWVRVSNQNLALDDQWFSWRERVTSGFEPSTQPAAPGLEWVENIETEDGPIIDPGAFPMQFDVQVLVVVAFGRVRRGQTV